MKPFPAKSLDDASRVFNYRLSRARRVSENAFGIVVHRFQIFLSTIPLEPKKAEFIFACAQSVLSIAKLSQIQSLKHMNCRLENGGITQMLSYPLSVRKGLTGAQYSPRQSERNSLTIF